MDFPRYVFYVPGPNQDVGFTYDHLLVEGQDEFDLAISEGFNETIAGAKEDFDKRDPKEPEPGLGTVGRKLKKKED